MSFFVASYSDLHIIKTGLLTAILYKKVPLFINFPNIFKAIADLKKNTAIITISNIIQMRMFMQLFCCNELNPVLWMTWGPDTQEHPFVILPLEQSIILRAMIWGSSCVLSSELRGQTLTFRPGRENFYSWEGFVKLLHLISIESLVYCLKGLCRAGKVLRPVNYRKEVA